MTKAHNFHIPVMGIGYTIDTPLKIAHYGIDSTISLVDDILFEKLRKMYCGKNNLPYIEISDKDYDYRAARITAYLNLINKLATKKFIDLKNNIEEGSGIRKYFSMLPGHSELKKEFRRISANHDSDYIRTWLSGNMKMGSIDVNIMTKIDKTNYHKGEKLPVEYNDAHAALRGYALSELRSSLVLSAGINPRLYTYMQHFDDFYADESGDIKKKIVLKVSDYKSALVQGKFLAKKGLWVSEYRIESGLNCGGHAFASDGKLMGPVLDTFKRQKQELTEEIHEILIVALAEKQRPVPFQPLPLLITAQGGVGTAEEHRFLIDHYGVDSVGWGTPFLLVPEATTVDELTLQQLKDAKEKDLYLSNISPLGVPFNSLRGNTKDLEKLSLIEKGRPGSSCSKHYAALSNEFSEKTICTASRRYQSLKIKELAGEQLSNKEYSARYASIVNKSCICVGLGTSSLLANHLDTSIEGAGVSVCPGPNMAYFSRTMSLSQITDHIYDRDNMIDRTDRPNMFIKELEIYLSFLEGKISEYGKKASAKQIEYLREFISDIENGIAYYENLFGRNELLFKGSRPEILKSLRLAKRSLAQHLAGLPRLAATPRLMMQKRTETALQI